MKYKGGEKTLVVTPETVVVAYAPGDKAEVKPGTGIFISAAEKKPDGTLLTPAHHLRQGRPHAADVGGPRQRNSSSPSKATGTSSG